MKTVEGKVVVLGSQGVGKTSMVVRYIGKMFSHHSYPTLGASFFTCKIVFQDVKVKIEIWDTAGQERFRSMVPMYYRNANAALLVFDITRYHTFTSVKHWVDELQKNISEPMVLILIGNKTDLINQRQVSREEALLFAQNINGLYYESSALQDHGVEDIFLTTADELIKLSKNPECSTIRCFDTNDDGTVVTQREMPSTLKETLPFGEPVTKKCCY